MPQRRIPELGTQGLNLDQKPALLDVRQFSGGRFVRFRDGAITPAKGLEPWAQTPTIAPTWIDYIPDITEGGFWVISNGIKMQAFSAGTFYNITPASDFATSAGKQWLLELFGGVPVFTDDTAVPHTWDLQTGNAMVPLVNWPAGYTCKAIRGFKSHLIALNVTKSGIEYPHTVLWSKQAEPGALPTSWDIADPTSSAGEVTIPDTDKGTIVNGLVLGNMFIIYKEGSIHGLRYVGGNSIFARDPLSPSYGLSARDSLVTIPSRRPAHFFLSAERICVFDGVNFTFPFEGRLESWIFKSLALDYQEKSFSVINRTNYEVQAFFPSEDTTCTLAAVWNYKDNTTTVREVDRIDYAADGLTPSLDALIASAGQGTPYEEGTVFHDEGDIGFLVPQEQGRFYVVCEVSSQNASRIFVQDVDYKWYDENALNCYIERTSLPVVNYIRGEYEVDFTRRKLITTIWPHLGQGKIYVELGMQEFENSPITWSAKMEYNSETMTQVRLSTPLSGRFIAVRFSQVPGFTFQLSSFDLEIDVLGQS